jgi:serine/threonine protein kinase
MPLPAGSRFAGFTIERLLGAGGMGEVYLAQHPRLPRRDALKILPSNLSDDPDYRARFEREADLASTLWHPHIVGVHDRGETDGQLWIAMDFVDGLDAGRLLAQLYSRGVPTNLVVRVVTAAASALDHAHRQGLLHRDVKPANIMLSSHDNDHEQRILLTDFGIARKAGDISGLTATNMTVGTVAFAAPEQLMGDALDGRADQYALAATAFTLLTGNQLFAHSNPAVVISRHLNAPPPSIGAAGMAAVDTVLARALAKDANDRFPRCIDFALALAAAATVGSPSTGAATLNAVAVADHPAKTAAKEPDVLVQSETSNTRPRWLLVSSVVGIALVLGSGVMTWRPWHHDSLESTITPAPVSPRPSAIAPPPLAASPTAPPRPAATDVQTTNAVIHGQPADGFHEVSNPASDTPLDCEKPSHAALTANVYYCYPNSAGADICWSSPPTSMLCLDNPWDKELRRYTLSTLPLLPVQHGIDPWPYALELDNGARCRLLMGMRDMRSNGDTPEYDCGSGQSGFVVLSTPGSAYPINRASPIWTVKAGSAGAAAQTRTVTRAWFAVAN